MFTPYQKKCYARMYRLRLAERKRFSYKPAYLYEQIRKMHELHEEYLVVVKYDVKSYIDLFELKLRLQRVDEELSKAQKEMYRERGLQKRSCKNVEDMVSFEASESDYRERLGQIKLQKKDNHKKLKAVERCLGREGSLLEAELELRIPVGDMEDIEKIARDEVPENPYRVQESVAVPEENISAVSEPVVDEIVEADVIMASEVEAVGETDIPTITSVDDPMVVSVDEVKSAAMSDETDLVQDDIQEHKEQARLPSNKAEYMKMSVAEKVRCYPFDTRGTDLAFEIVKAYFETLGLSTDFSSVYEEAKLLTECYEKQKAEGFIQERTEQVIVKMDMLGIDADKITAYSTDVLSVVFGFGDMEYYTGIKLFNKVLDRLGVDMPHQERYEVFDRIYEEGMREEKVENGRNSR